MASIDYLNKQRAWHLRQSYGSWGPKISNNPHETTTISDWKTNRRMIRTPVQTRTISPYQQHYAPSSIIHIPTSLQVRGKYATFPKWTNSPMIGTINFPTEPVPGRKSAQGFNGTKIRVVRKLKYDRPSSKDSHTKYIQELKREIQEEKRKRIKFEQEYRLKSTK